MQDDAHVAERATNDLIESQSIAGPLGGENRRVVGHSAGGKAWELSPFAEAMIAVAAVVLVGLLAVGGVWFSAASSLRETLQRDMSRLALVAAAQVDPVLHEAIRKPEQIDTPEYAAAVAPLRRFRSSAVGIKYVYTMVLDDGGKVRFILDAADPGDHDGDGREDRSGVWEEYESKEPPLERALGEGGRAGIATASDKPYTDEWGTFVSGYAPIVDAGGRQIGIVGVDMDAGDYVGHLVAMRNVALMGSVPAFLSALGVGLVVYKARSRSRTLLVEANRSRLAADRAFGELNASTAEVRELYDRLHKISTQVPGALYQFRLWPDGNCCFPYASAGMEAIYGVEPEELRADASVVFRRVHPDDVGRVRESIAASAAALEPWQLEYRLVDDDGTVRWILGSSAPQAEADGAVLWHGFLTDITERKRSDDQLVSARQRFEAVKRVVRMGLWEYEPATDKLSWDGEMHEIFDLPPEEFSGRMSDARSRVHPEDWEATSAAFRAAVEGLGGGDGGEFSSRFRIVRRDGTHLWVTGQGLVIRDLAGNPIRVVGLNIDVDQQVKAETELAAARSRAEAAGERAELASRAKSEFLANMSHEIRTPLTAILGYADIIADADMTRSAAETADLARTIQSAGQHLLTVINDILDISKVEAGRMTVEAVRMSPGEAISGAIAILLPRATARGLELTAEVDPAVPAAIASDPVRLRQIVMNLVGNALKFTEKGSVRVVMRSAPMAAGAALEVDVVDSGVGLSAAEAGRLFSAFTQADSSVTRKHGGTGLGLVISRRLAELMGGDVQLVRSEKGVGSCFRLTFTAPVLDATPWKSGDAFSAADALPPPVGVHATAKPLAGVRILLAEDSTDNQKLISFHLRRAGAAVVIVSNGLEALRELERVDGGTDAFHLLVTDMQMPEMDGYTLVRTLRDRGVALPAIALTAHAMAEDRQRCLAAGCNDYTTKPIDAVKLRDVCAKWAAVGAGAVSSAA